ncbi:MAG: elongation of very long chain fatty acids protein [Candidatus Obscuribacterales bacterium]|nr:elongation of very long chain fatty acids protein [Candidatus Obscuribacterales bacterium]
MASDFLLQVKELVYPDAESWKDFRWLNVGSHGPLLAPYRDDHLIPLVGSVGYVILSLLAEKILAAYDLKPFSGRFSSKILKWSIFFHNVFLSLFSLYLFVVLGLDLADKWLTAGTEVMLCDSQYTSSQGRVVWWYYLFYLSKYYEFMDTVFLIIKRKNVIFLHRYHHFITVLFAYINLSAEVGMQWIVIITNLFVHIPMYAYFAATTLGYSPPWKSWMTKTQIIQFVFDCVMAIWAGTYKYWWQYPCAGSDLLWGFDVLVILSFLFLFLSFHSSTYPARTAGGVTPARASEKKDN